MKQDIQDEINLELLYYCERLEKENKEQSKRMDMLLDILEEVAKKIAN